MSLSQSNLSDPKYGYDLVVAVTQASINATMKRFLASVSEPEVIGCYVYDDNNNLVPIDYTTLKSNAGGSDPFSVLAGADPNTNQDLINLMNANFAGAFKAMIGLPDNILPASLPPIVTLGNATTAPVLFNLFCSEFQITGFEYGPRGKATWINQSQPNDPANPTGVWYFSSNVSLNNTTINPQSPVTPAVQQRIQELTDSPWEGSFSVQQLFLDLDTAILETTPSIVGIPPGWSVWSSISSVFLNSYFTQLRTNPAIQPVLAYSFVLANPHPSTMQLGAISHECCALLDNNGQAVVNPTPQQQNAAAFVYMGTADTTPPVASMFGWNWIDLGEVSQYSGVLSVKRAVFLNFLAGLLNSDVGNLCLQTLVTLTHSGDNYSVLYTVSGLEPSPPLFQLISPVGQPVSDGFTDVLTVSYTHNSSDDSKAADHMSHIYGTFNYSLSGTVAANSNQLRITLTAQAYMEFNHHELGVNYNDLEGANYYNKTETVLYTLGVTLDGQLVVTQTNSLSDNSTPWNFTPKGILGKFGAENNVKNGLNDVNTKIGTYIDSAFTSYVDSLTNEINNYHSWVFPGADSFTMNKLSFSSGLDLTTHLTYTDPTMNTTIQQETK